MRTRSARYGRGYRPQRFGRRYAFLAVLICGLTLGVLLGRPAVAQTVRQDEVILHSGQSLFGSVKENRTDKGTELHVQTQSGWTLILDRNSYLRWKPEPEELATYREIRDKAKWTLEDQLKLAKWCDENRLDEQAERHYRIALEIDPRNETALDELGYVHTRSGEWVNREELKQRLGYQKIGSRWELPEVEQLRKLQEERKAVEVEWKQKVRLMVKKAFRPGRNQPSNYQELLGLQDPRAVPALIEELEEAQEDLRRARNVAASQLPFNKQQTLIRILCNIPSYESSKRLAKFYLLNQNDPESRDRVIEVLLKREDYQRTLMADFAAALNPQFEIDGETVSDPDLNTSRMGRAAYGLEEIGVPFAIESLIRALQVTYTKVTNVQANSAFGGNGSASVNPAGSKRVDSTTRECRQALDALRTFTGQDFGYDRMAWVQWWILENTPVQVDLRRDQ